MQTGILENIPQLGKFMDMKPFDAIGNEALAATRELISINSRMLEQFIDNQVELAKLYLEGGESQIKAVGHAGDFRSYASMQTELFNEYAAKFSRAAENNYQLAMHAGEQLQGWVKKNMDAAEQAARQSVAAKPAQKPKSKAPGKARAKTA